MTSINDLLNRKKDITNGETNQTTTRNQISSKKSFKIRIRNAEDNSKNSNTIKHTKINFPPKQTKPESTNGKTGNQIHTEKPNNSPFAQLRNTFKDNPSVSVPSIKSVLCQNETSNESARQINNAETTENTISLSTQPSERRSNFYNPTLNDVSKFVFKEQPDDSTVDITDKFSDMLDSLSTAVGSDVPYNLATCLKFIKEHAFLADILKPEHIGTMVDGMRKSYGFIVQVKSQKSVKKTEKKAKEDAVMGDLADLNLDF